MIEQITISSKIDSEFEFEMVAQGVSLTDAKVLFQTEINSDIKYDVQCKHVTADRWSVNIPKELIPNGAYNFKLCVIVDDFYFEPVKGMLRVVSEETIKVFGVSPEVEKQEESKPKKETKKKKVTESKEPKQSERAKYFAEKATEVEEEKKTPDLDLISSFAKDKPEPQDVVDEVSEEIMEEAQPEPTAEAEEVETTPEVETIEETIEPEPTPTIKVDVTPTPDSLFSENSVIRQHQKKKDTNKKIQEALQARQDQTPEVTGTQEPRKAFSELEEMKRSNEVREKNKRIKEAAAKSKKK